MSGTVVSDAGAAAGPHAQTGDMKLEVVVLPVADVDRSKRFYVSLGWRLDADFVFSERSRVVQFTPPGSGCSLQFGKGLTSAEPGSVQGLFLIVPDIESTRAALVARGVDASEVFHRVAGERVLGPDPSRRSYGSFTSFKDPDGNSWLVQEVTSRLPGRVDASKTTFSSANDLAGALRRAAAAHGEHEKRTGQNDVNWPDWYADYLVREQSGQQLPS